MRRNEFEIMNRVETEAFLQEMTFGFLGTEGDNGPPHITPLNFVYHNEAVYFHGSRIGQKMADLRRSLRVSFAIAKEYAIIPSYFSDPKLACPATSYFKSVYIEGTAAILDSLEEKAEALAAFMRKLQPEGGYDPITPDDPDYVPQLKGVAVVKITIDKMTAKFKFGQNLRENRREKLVDSLQERGADLDEETVQLMRKYCPAHREG